MARMVITANRLRDGAVVWRGAAGNWSPHITAAAIHANGEQLTAGLAAALADEKIGRVIGVHEVEIETRGGQVLPTRLRERVRADGPTVSFA